MREVALITGASSGIGRELAKIHASKGKSLVIVARRLNKLQELKKELESMYNIEVLTIEKDLTQLGATEEVYEEIKERGIEIEYLINNAGFGGIGEFYRRNWEDDQSMIQLNIVALASLTRLFLPDFLQRNRGRILNISSTASLMPGPLQSVYYASKAFVTSFSNAISEEIKDSNVTVTVLLPGPTRSEFADVSGMNNTKLFDKSFSSESVAEDGYKAMMEGKLNKVTGVSFGLRLMLKLLPFAPKKMVLKYIYEGQKTRE